MNITKVHNLACPLDGLPVQSNEKQYVCPNGHSFDVARQGYINLLPVQQKRSKNPGDSEEMILARSAFLNAGLYRSIADQFNDVTNDLLMTNLNPEVCLLDAGCGEGYYLEYLLHHLEQADIKQDVSFIGLDISKPAIVAAAKRSTQITWLVASNKQPPVLLASVDIIFCLFGFPVYDSFRQLLKPAGKIILVEAGPEHLIELRKIIYPIVNKSPPPDTSLAEKSGFNLLSESSLTYKTGSITNLQLTNLLCMTPHLYRASQEGKQAASQLDSLDVTVDVVFRVLDFQSH